MRRYVFTIVVLATSQAALAGESKWPSRVPSTEVRGEAIYKRNCISCHGPKAAGDGPMASSLVVNMPDLSKGLGKKDVSVFIPLVMNGAGAMPGFSAALRDLLPPSGNFDDAAEDVLRYMASLSGAPMPPDLRHKLTDKERDAEIQSRKD